MSAADEHADGLPDDDEQIKRTAPDLPWEMTLKQSKAFFQRVPGKGMILKFVPAVGQQIMPPAVTVQFDQEGWERFKKLVQADGEMVALHTPNGVELLRR